MFTITSCTRRQLTELRKELERANESCNKYEKDLEDIQGGGWRGISLQLLNLN